MDGSVHNYITVRNILAYNAVNAFEGHNHFTHETEIEMKQGMLCSSRIDWLLILFKLIAIFQLEIKKMLKYVTSFIKSLIPEIP